MADRTVSLRVETDTDFDQVARDADASMRRAATAIERSASQIEGSLDDAAEGISGSLDRAGRDAEKAGDRIEKGLDIGDAFDGVGDQAARAFDDVEKAADRAADGTAAAFDGVSRDIDRDLDGVGDDAERSFDDVEKAADRAADGTAAAFDDVPGKIKRDLDGIGDDAARAFDDVEKAADRAADGLDASTSSALDGLAGKFAEFGSQSGSELSESLIGGVDLSNLGGTLTGALSSLSGAAGPIGAAAAALGAVFGDEIAAGISRSFGRRKRDVLTAVEFALPETAVSNLGRSAGEAYSAGFGEGFAELRETAATLEATLGRIDDNFNLDTALTETAALNTQFGLTDETVAKLSRRLVATNLVGDSGEALDLLAASSARFRVDIEEILPVLDEFAPVFSKLGLDGAEAIGFIGATVEEGLLPNVDRAAELFEEFNVRLSETDTLRPTIRQLGLDYGEMQSKLASGEGEEAIKAIASALLSIEDPARRNALAIEVFGTSIESASDPERVIELLAQGAALDDVAGSASDLSATLEENRSSWDRISRGVEDAVADIASGWDFAIGKALDAEEAFRGFGETVISGPLTEGLEWLGLKSEDAAEALGLTSEELARLQELTGSTAEELVAVSEETGRTGEEMLGLEEASAAATASLEVVAGGLQSTGDAATSAADAAATLDQVLTDFAARFEADEAFLALADDIDAITEAATGATGEVYSLGEGFDRNTEQGRNLEGQFINLSENLDNMIGLYQEGQISADDLSGAQQNVENTIRDVARQMGLTEAETQQLINKYASVPDEISTDVDVVDNATAALGRVSAAISRIPPRVSVEVIQRTIDTFGRFARRAHGGLASGWTLVGEEGPELVDFATAGRVYSAAETRVMLDLPHLATGGVAYEPAAVVIGDNPNAGTDPELVAPQSLIEEAVRRALDGTARRAAPLIGEATIVTPPGRSLWDELDEATRAYEAVAA